LRRRSSGGASRPRRSGKRWRSTNPGETDSPHLGGLSAYNRTALNRQTRLGRNVILAVVAIWQSVSTTEGLGRLVELQQQEVELVKGQSAAEQT